MYTKFGPEAQDGDYVIVLDVNYVSRSANNYIAKVYKNKAYTGRTICGKPNKYIHKLSAETVISAAIVPQALKDQIEEDIEIHNEGYKRYGSI